MGIGFLLAVLFLIGCSSVRPLPPHPPAGRQTRLGSGTVILPNTQRILAGSVHLAGDSIGFMETSSGVLRHLHRSDVDTILILSRGAGFFQGMGLGFLSGMVVGVVVSQAIISSCDPYQDGGCIEADLEGVLAGGTIGTLIMWSGAIYGASRGSKVYYPRIYTPLPSQNRARRAAQTAPSPLPTSPQSSQSQPR
jgi:hypothetical protein